MSTSSAPDLTVVFVVGNPRSGSTLLTNLLGELDGVVALGELSNLWVNGVYGAHAVCGCGLPIVECPYWAAVLGPLLAKGQFRVVRTAQERAVRAANLWSTPPADSHHLAQMAELYRAAARHSGARVVVDSSKSAAYAATYNRLPGMASQHIHIVRDPRGIAHSRQRGWQRRDTESASSAPRLPATEAARVAASWVRHNLAAETLVRRWRRSSLRLRYEDLMAEPEATLRTVAASLGVADGPLPFTAPHTAVLHTQHTAAGNPSRFATGDIQLREDRAWHQGLPRGHQRLVTAVAAPLLRRYGYPLSPPGGAPSTVPARGYGDAD